MSRSFPSRCLGLIAISFLGGLLLLGCDNDPASSDLKAQEAGAENAQANGPEKPAAEGPEAQLQKDVAEAISLLEKGEVAKFLDWYLPLEDLERIREEATLEEAAKAVKAEGFDKKLLEKFREMKKADVEFLDKDKSKARLVAKTKADEPDRAAVEVPNPAEEKIPEYKGFAGELPEAIGQAVKALEAGDNRKFIENMFPEAELYLTKTDEGRNAILQRLKEHPKMVQQMLADLKTLQKQKPEYNAEKTIATFVLNPDTKQARTVKFEKAGTWRMANTAKQIRGEVYKQSQRKPLGIQDQDKPGPEWIRIRDHWRLTKLPDLNG